MKRPHPRAYLRRRRYISPRLFSIPHEPHKRRIAVITDQLSAGGVESVLLGIVESLPNDSFEITIYISGFNNNSWKYKFENKCTVIDFNDVDKWAEEPELVADYITASIIKNHFDLVFITNSLIGYKILPRIHRKSILQHRRIVVVDLLHTHGTPTENDAFLRLSAPYAKYIDRRVMISHYLKSYLEKKFPSTSSRSIVIYNGIQLKGMKNKYSQSTGRSILGIENGHRKAITYVGRLQADKSPLRLVKLAYMLRTELTSHNAFIAVFGDGIMRKQLEDRSRELGVIDKTIKFYGKTDEPLSVMSASYFTILTSDLEGIPMSALESMSVGTPVIAPSVGGIPEIVKNGSGILIDFTKSRDEDTKMLELKNCVMTALNLKPDNIKKMSSKSKHIINKDFSHMGQDYLQLLQELL